jgi:hypothetical protein
VLGSLVSVASRWGLNERVCFSPQADVVGGLVVCAIGIDAVRHIRQRREFIALAWIPLLLGAHQFIEALVWLWLQGHVPRGIGHVALWAYLLIAFVVLPVFVPLAVIALEPTGRRKAMMAPFALTGTVIAVVLFAAMARGPVGVQLAPYHLSYSIRVPDGPLVIALYVVAVCGPLLMSGYRNVVIFGAAGRPSRAPRSRCTAVSANPKLNRAGSKRSVGIRTDLIVGTVISEWSAQILALSNSDMVCHSA